MGTLVEPLPVTGYAANFLPIPRMAPPLLGRAQGGYSDLTAESSGLGISVDVVCKANPPQSVFASALCSRCSGS